MLVICTLFSAVSSRCFTRPFHSLRYLSSGHHKFNKLRLLLLYGRSAMTYLFNSQTPNSKLHTNLLTYFASPPRATLLPPKSEGIPKDGLQSNVSHSHIDFVVKRYIIQLSLYVIFSIVIFSISLFPYLTLQLFKLCSFISQAFLLQTSF